MSPNASLDAVLKEYQDLSRELLRAAESDARSIADAGGTLAAESAADRRRILPRLEACLRELRRHRERWQRLSPADRAREASVAPMLRAAQDALMKIILRDRENEQRMLRSGTVPATHVGQVPPAARPHYVADLYRRHTPA
jgi:hypothetical protein